MTGFSITGNTQDIVTTNTPSKTTKILGGVGLGIDYGGIFGIRAEYQPIKNMGVLGGLGYNLNGFGFNFGAAYYLFPEWKAQPYVMALYGYNSVIAISGMTEYNKTYYGFSTGIGFAVRTKDKGNKLVFELFKPFRNQQFKDDYDDLKKNPSIQLNQLFIFTFSVGYNWVL